MTNSIYCWHNYISGTSTYEKEGKEVLWIRYYNYVSLYEWKQNCRGKIICSNHMFTLQEWITAPLATTAMLYANSPRERGQGSCFFTSNIPEMILLSWYYSKLAYPLGAIMQWSHRLQGNAEVGICKSKTPKRKQLQIWP